MGSFLSASIAPANDGRYINGVIKSGPGKIYISKYGFSTRYTLILRRGMLAFRKKKELSESNDLNDAVNPMTILPFLYLSPNTVLTKKLKVIKVTKTKDVDSNPSQLIWLRNLDFCESNIGLESFFIEFPTVASADEWYDMISYQSRFYISRSLMEMFAVTGRLIHSMA